MKLEQALVKQVTDRIIAGLERDPQLPRSHADFLMATLLASSWRTGVNQNPDARDPNIDALVAKLPFQIREGDFRNPQINGLKIIEMLRRRGFCPNPKQLT
jgi:hypothetical protein